MSDMVGNHKDNELAAFFIYNNRLTTQFGDEPKYFLQSFTEPTLVAILTAFLNRVI